MKIQEQLSNCCQTVQTWASQAASWASKTVSTIASTGADFARKVAEKAKPYFESAQNFVSQNKPYSYVAGVAFAAGALLIFLLNKCCCVGKEGGANALRFNRA